MLGRIKFAIEPLVNEILDQLPPEVWTSKTTTFLDPAMGGGQFVKEIERRLRKAGHMDSNISGRVFGCETSLLSVKYAVNKYKLLGTYSVGDFLAQDFGNMKFDVIVGNPPYQNKEENADGSLWLQFVNKGIAHIQETGKLIFVTPTSWVGKQSNTKKADWTPFTNNHVELYKVLSKREKDQYFGGVGSKFGYYMLSKGKGTTRIIFEDGSFTNYQLVPKEPLPNSITKVSFSIHKKLTKHAKIQFDRNFKFHSQNLRKKGILSDTKGNGFQYKTYFSHNLIRFTSEKQDIYSQVKVMIPNVGTIANAWADKNCNLTEDVTFVTIDNGAYADNLVSILKSKLFLYIGTQYRSGRNLGMAVKMLPKLDYTKSWTDSDIYSYFNLTQEEIDYIESNVK